jgi:hypothetical protein
MATRPKETELIPSQAFSEGWNRLVGMVNSLDPNDKDPNGQSYKEIGRDYLEQTIKFLNPDSNDDIPDS